ncbi:MAG: FAD-dependent oxidoreductase [Deltaproteobacteria bacterium]|nr:FAD-dependent oxidoreductase [Deltaproteobacteria bacterium]MCL5892261.1 FAD-dependent oxidoreductase [Deltaproteobacteria bacterium]
MKIIDKIGSKLDISFFKRTGHAEISSILNWNGIALLDDRDNKVDLARCYMQELQKISCGVCTPCMIGTSVASDILEHICNGRAILEDLDRLRNQCEWILSSSKCTVGTMGPLAVTELIDNFREDFENAIKNKETIPKGDYITKVTAPCINGCPSKLDIPNWIERVRDGRFEDALESARRNTPLAGILGRTCFHPCQDNCRRANVDEPIQICLIRRFAADNEFYSDIKPKFVIKDNGIKIAIVGSGPAGLSCAYYLRLMGYKPAIFEALPVLGGMMNVGIPKYRLPKEFLDKEIDYILSTGIDYKLNQRLGTDFTIQDLFGQDFKAVFLAVGAHKGQNIGLPGEQDNLKGFYEGVKFLRDVSLGNKIETGRKVIIEGGGNVAIDCCRTAIRLGFEEVIVVYRRAREQMPAAPYEIDTAIQEGVKFEFLTNPVSIIQENGAVKGVKCRKMKLGDPDESGRRSPVEVPGSDFDIECDSFIMAVGQVPDFDFLKDTPQIKTGKGKIIIADEFTHMTDMPGVFAGGDAFTGPISIVDSNRDGKNAARRIDQYIRTGSFEATDDCLFEYLLEKIGVYDKKEIIDYTDFPKGNPAAKQVEEDVEMRISNFMEVDKGLTSDDVIYEATRCMRCYFLMLVKFK